MFRLFSDFLFSFQALELNFCPAKVDNTAQEFIKVDRYQDLEMHLDIKTLLDNFEKDVKNYNIQMQNLHLKYSKVYYLSSCYNNFNLQTNIHQFEKDMLELMDIPIPPVALQTMTKTSEYKSKKKRSLVPIVGTILNKLIGTGTEAEEEAINENVHILDKNYNILHIEVKDIITAINASISEQENIKSVVLNENIRLENLETNLTLIYELNKECFDISTLINRQVNKYRQVGEKLLDLKHEIPYGKLLNMIMPNKIYEVFNNISKKYRKPLKLTSENINKMPVWNMKITHKKLIYKVKIPIIKYPKFHMFKITPVPFVYNYNPCNEKSCSLYIVNIKPSVIGISEDHKYFSLKPENCETSSRAPISICTGYSKVQSPNARNCLINLITSKNNTIENCHLSQLSVPISLPHFDNLGYGNSLILSNKNINIDIKCNNVSYNKINVNVEPGSYPLKLGKNCSLLYLGEEQLTGKEAPRFFVKTDIAIPTAVSTRVWTNFKLIETNQSTHVAYFNGKMKTIYMPNTNVQLIHIKQKEKDVGNTTYEYLHYISGTSLAVSTVVLLTIIATAIIAKSRKRRYTLENQNRRKAITLAMKNLDVDVEVDVE